MDMIAHEALVSPRRSSALACHALDGLKQGILVIDHALRVRLANPAAVARLGLAERPVGRPRLDRLVQAASRLDPPAQAGLVEVCAAAVDAGRDLELAEVGVELSVAVKGLPDRFWLVTLDPPGANDPGRNRDPLTGLPDRTVLHARMTSLLDRTGCAAVLLLDLDRFKSINDSLGHPAGDALLRLVAERLQSALRPADVTCRLGGDEFAVLLDDPAAAATLAERLVDLLSRPYLVQGHLANVGASIGLAIAPDDGVEPDTLIRRADLALYAAKSEGRQRWCRFEIEMEQRAQARRSLEIDLRRALKLRQLELHYQPQFDLAQKRIVGFEALLRWRHPTRGLVAPGDFIPLAEETGLIRPIGAWVLHSACQTAARWDDRLTIAVNVSSLQFSGDRLLQEVLDALKMSGLAPNRLDLEITESTLLRRDRDVFETLRALRGLGVRISIDDFGTGYSSLSQLTTFPFDKIKIDRSFVSELGVSAEATAIVRAIASLGISLGMSTVVEGVETADQATIVEAKGCTHVQGYLISRPVESRDVADLLERYNSAPLSVERSGR